MRRSSFRAPEPVRAGGPSPSGGEPADGPGTLQQTVSGDGGRAVRAGLARMDGLIPEAGRADEDPRPLHGGRQRSSGTGRSDGGAVGTTRGDERDARPRFDVVVTPDGYHWWYVDALSDDGAYGLTVIAFIGSVFSPYYAWTHRRDPYNHCAINVALYGPRGARWSMTERGRKSIHCTADRLGIGPSALTWDGNALTIDIDEVSAPIPRRIKGKVRITPPALNGHEFTLDTMGRHFWRPIAPLARVSVEMQAPELCWSGNGYLDMNHGSEPLEDAFRYWTWSRASLGDGAGIVYDAERRAAPPLSLALRFDTSGCFEQMDPPRQAELPRTKWFVPRQTRSDDGHANVVRTLEDTPFYSRSEIASKLFGENVRSVHESLSLDRVAHPVVRLMLPFRMPRRG